MAGQVAKRVSWVTSERAKSGNAHRLRELAHAEEGDHLVIRSFGVQLQLRVLGRSRREP